MSSLLRVAGRRFELVCDGSSGVRAKKPQSLESEMRRLGDGGISRRGDLADMGRSMLRPYMGAYSG